MTPPRSTGRARSLAVALPLTIVLATALSACTPLSLFANWGGSPRSSQGSHQTPEAAPTATPTPRASRTPSGTATPGCIDRVISAAGVYRIDDCENLTVAGSNIKVTAAHLGTLTVNGDSLQVLAQTIGALDVNGSLNDVQANDGIGTIVITGDRNMITSHASVTSAIVTGDDNTVVADGGVDGAVENNGQRNQIGAQP